MHISSISSKEEGAKKLVNPSPFEKLRRATVEIVVDWHGGATSMTCDEWREALIEQDPDLRGCSDSVFEHMNAALRMAGLATGALRDWDGKVKVVYDITRFTLETARRKCEHDGLTPGAKMHFMDTRKRVRQPALSRAAVLA